MEGDQLAWERSILDMPFLDDEELPFLREFDNHPEVSVQDVLDILQTTASSTSENTREHYHAVFNRGPGETLYTAFSANLSQSIMNEQSSTYSFNTAPVEEALQPPYVYLAHNQYAVGAQYTVHDQGELVMNNHSASHTSSATPAEGAPSDASRAQSSNDRLKRMKRTCRTCAQRKIKCLPISGSEPKICEFCSKRGMGCEFEERKVYTRSGA